jgi:hypothetical protein
MINKLFRMLKTLFARFGPYQPAMVGTPPSARAIRSDSIAHALDFANRYAEPLDYVVSQRMMELGIPDDQIGRPDPQSRGRWLAFFPHEGNGGGVVGNWINADAGLFDISLMNRIYGRDIGKNWARDRLRDRLDQVIAHEYAEASGITHQEAIQRAAETPLPIREAARKRLRAIAKAENFRDGR